MDIEVNATAIVTRMDAPTRANEVEARFRLGFFLKDTLMVFGEDENEDEVEMKQCCYEQKIVDLLSSRVHSTGSLKRVVYNTLLNDMHMDPQAAETARDEVASTITNSIQSVRRFSQHPCTILMDVRVNCTIEKRGGRRRNEPTGQHGYRQLQERVEEEECGICQGDCSSSKDLIVTPCHHIYHRSCIFQWLNRTRYTCPMCRSNCGPMIGRQIEFA